MVLPVGPMTVRVLGWFVLVTLGLLLALSLAGRVAEWWLESSGGRSRLEAELSSQLGMEVRLAGDYRLRLLPRLSLDGDRLEIRRTGSAEAFALVEAYEASVEWLPFLDGEVHIRSVGLSGGQVRPEFFAAPAGPAVAAASAAPLTLPSIAALSISGFSFPVGGADARLVLDQLDLRAFEPGKVASIGIRVHYQASGDRVAAARLSSAIMVDPARLSVHLAVDSLDVDWGEFAYAGMAGPLDWDYQAATLAARLVGMDQGRPLELAVEVRYAGDPAGAARLHYREPGWATALAAELEFAVTERVIDLPLLRIELEQQAVAGRGCVVLPGTDDGEISVRMLLSADHLDVDRLASRAADWIPLEPGRTDPWAMPELPVALDLALQAGRLTWQGATLEEVEITAGAVPSCAGWAAADAE